MYYPHLGLRTAAARSEDERLVSAGILLMTLGIGALIGWMGLLGS